jgi:anti-sigma B factor antagonist
VRLRGAILFGKESASLRAFVKELLSKARQIVLDLTDVTRIDSAGVGTLVGLFVSARNVGTVIKLSNPGNHANEILRITRLVTVSEIFSTTEETIASFTLSATRDSLGRRVSPLRTDAVQYSKVAGVLLDSQD